MVVESVMVGVVYKARVVGYLFRRSYVVEVRGVLKIPQIVVVLEHRHGGGWVGDGTAPGEKLWRCETR